MAIRAATATSGNRWSDARRLRTALEDKDQTGLVVLLSSRIIDTMDDTEERGGAKRYVVEQILGKGWKVEDTRGSMSSPARGQGSLALPASAGFAQRAGNS